MRAAEPPPKYRDPRPQPPRDEPITPGRQAVVMMMLAIGILLLAIQLWLLTIALDLYLAGRGESVWLTCLCSGLIFLGGLLVMRLLERQDWPR
ncbi:hypothetical protein F8S13_20155 [Chloroflexia bacterium SDU3-3]|nr:hypothetical protein F8S13_20155 [Chloroflexia bacterium SDU3-3]